MSGIFERMPPPRILTCPECGWQQYAYDQDIEATIRAAVLREVREAVEGLDSYDLETTGYAYNLDLEMVKQKIENEWSHGEWVRRKAILALFAPAGKFGAEKGDGK